MRRATLAIVAAASVLAAGAPLGAQSPADSSTTRAIAGCYRLTRLRWSTRPPSYPQAQNPPSRFRLDATELSHTLMRGWAVEPSVLVGTARVPAAWRSIARDSIDITWSTGFSGVRLRLRVSGDSLVGGATTFHDAHAIGEPPDPTATVRAVRTGCGTAKD